MPYQRIVGGYRYRQHIAAGHQAAAKIRRVVESALDDRTDLAALYMKIAAITLLTTRIDDILNDLADYHPETDP